MEKILPYDRAIVAQEHYWDCGPASAQIILNGRSIIESEDALIRQIGTTTNGTDYVGLIERVLARRMPQAQYKSVYLERDPATPAQKEQLWRDVVRSIDAGFGVVMNFVAPPRNYPRGVKGSESPAYRGGTVYHYVACMGYSDDGERAFWIADPGFRPFGYWCSWDQVATLIPPKGYAVATAGAAPGPVTDPVRVLSRVMGGRLSDERYRQLLPAVSKCLADSGCTTVERIAMWVAQVGHESGGLRWMEEIADGSAYNNRADLGNGPTDGPRFKGRGPIQVTGRSNYTNLSRWAHGKGLVPTPTFFVDQPSRLASDELGFVGVTWYWSTQRPLNDAADKRDLERATRYVNGGLNGLNDRRTYYDRALAAGNELLSLVSSSGVEDMAQVPQDQWDRLFREQTQEHESLSGYRTPGEGKVGNWSRIDRNQDQMLHQLFVEWSALELGDFDSLARIIRSAQGKGADKSPGFVNRAKKVLAKIEAANPSALKAYIDASKGAA